MSESFELSQKLMSLCNISSCLEEMLLKLLMSNTLARMVNLFLHDNLPGECHTSRKMVYTALYPLPRRTNKSSCLGGGPKLTAEISTRMKSSVDHLQILLDKTDLLQGPHPHEQQCHRLSHRLR